VEQRFRQWKWSVAAAAGVVVGALGVVAVGSAFSNRTTATTRQIIHFSSSMDSAGSKTLYEDGQFRLKGKCIDLGGGAFRAQAVIKTKSNNAAFTSSGGDVNDQDWDVADGFRKLQADGIAAQGTSAAPDFAGHTNESYFGAIRANGDEVLHGQVWSAVFHGPKCRWGGYLQRVVDS
jgi:hypothetical protein